MRKLGEKAFATFAFGVSPADQQFCLKCEAFLIAINESSSPAADDYKFAREAESMVRCFVRGENRRASSHRDMPL
jgi:hypothetical protein